MFDAIIGWLGALGAGALAIWGVRQKVRADRAKRQIEDYRLSSDRWQRAAMERVEGVRKEAAGKAPIDPKDRTGFE